MKKFLKPKLKNSSIENIFDFTIKEWEYNEQDILQKAKNYFKKNPLNLIPEYSITFNLE